MSVPDNFPMTTPTPDQVRWTAAKAAEAELRRQLETQTRLAQQLQTALDTRIIIEQAVGVLAERNHIDVKAAFELLRSASRNQNIRIATLAAAIIAGTTETKNSRTAAGWRRDVAEPVHPKPIRP